MKKKNLLLALAFVLVAGLTACGTVIDVDPANMSSQTKESASVEKSEDGSEPVQESSVSEEASVEASSEVVESSEEKQEGNVHYQPKQEILEANFEDFIFQIDDKLLQFNNDMTLEEFMSMLPEGTVLWDTSKKKEVELSRIITVDDSEGFNLRNLNREAKLVNGDIFGALTVKNETGDVATIGQARVLNFTLSESYVGDIYLPKGIVVNYRSTEQVYNIMEDERLTFTNIANTFDSYGVECVADTELDYKLGKESYAAYSTKDKVKYTLKAYLNEGRIQQTWGKKALIYYPSYTVVFEIDVDTGVCKSLNYTWFAGSTGWVDPTEYGFPAN